MSFRKFQGNTCNFSLSGDGKIAVGNVTFDQIDFLQACLWVDGQGSPLRRSEFNEGLPSHLRDFIGTRTVCTGIADDTVAVIGRFEIKNRRGSRGFHIADGHLTWLESNDWQLVHPRAISGDGRTVVGLGRGPGHTETACLWRKGLGVQPLDEHLKQAGIACSGWTLSEATGVCSRGSPIVGNGTNPNGQREAWILTLPDTSTTR